MGLFSLFFLLVFIVCKKRCITPKEAENMDDSQKTDQELLQCPPRVDMSTFPEVSANKIAQAYSKYIYK